MQFALRFRGGGTRATGAAASSAAAEATEAVATEFLSGSRAAAGRAGRHECVVRVSGATRLAYCKPLFRRTTAVMALGKFPISNKRLPCVTSFSPDPPPGTLLQCIVPAVGAG